MGAAPIPPDEPTRLEALAGCRILDTPPEPAFDDIAKLAAEICGVPMALVSLVDAERQWFKARVSMPVVQTDRSASFCAHAIHGTEPLVVPDALADARFADNPLVLGDPKVRFYAGVPLQIDAGSAVGTLCVLDHVPRELTPGQVEGLKALARQIQRELRLRREIESIRVRTRSAPSWSDLPVDPGDVIAGRWRVERQIGRGGTGAVFEARDRTGVRVAIKVLLPSWLADDSVVERFAREARALAQIESPRVARILDVGNLDDHGGNLPFLVLEYLEGTDLASELRRRGPIPWPEVVGWSIDVCDALATIHAAGIVHRDVKPANVFLARGAGDATHIKLLDLGIAKTDASPARAPLTDPRGMLGSPSYMAPEQMLAPRDVDARSDVWSLGVMLFELVSGAVPFAGATEIEACVGVMTRAPMLLRAARADAPAWLEAVVARCLERDRAARFPDVGAGPAPPPDVRALAAALREGLARAAATP